ncbi:MAG: YceI family protein [Jatrophihabitantaceae bacterium]
MTETLTRRWTVVASLSCAGFAVRNLGIRTVTGRIPIRDASVDVEGGGRPVTVRADLDLAGIDTGNARRDRDLAKPRLLDTGKYPVLAFAATAGSPDGTGWELPGVLTAHGASIDVVLAAEVLQRGDEVTVRARTWFDRRDLGVTVPRFFIGRRIDVTIDAVLRPASSPSSGPPAQP